MIYDYAYSTTANMSGIFLQNHSDRTVVSSNTIYATKAFAQYGINIAESDCDDVVVVGNVCGDGKGISDSGTNTQIGHNIEWT